MISPKEEVEMLRTNSHKQKSVAERESSVAEKKMQRTQLNNIDALRDELQISKQNLTRPKTLNKNYHQFNKTEALVSNMGNHFQRREATRAVRPPDRRVGRRNCLRWSRITIQNVRWRRCNKATSS